VAKKSKDNPVVEAVQRELDKTDRAINRAGVSGDPIVDGLKRMFDRQMKGK
jgi:hypothetical protein